MKETRLKKCEEMILRTMFGLNKEEATGGRIKVYNEVLHNQQSSFNSYYHGV
jgi:hypothetical protein